ncbi:hypothetical protein CSC67_07825 [Pusillimonas caeni]|uniref:type IV secretion system protein VirB10 n=1 Tax=Pusillimonas caeni TaxID=1348472 RepID=UPI000E599E5C|nr:type IV secretion system protein VirB10 [Pusillimonas caeni]TFL14436.1 hypothetical protein CSC67_07825 [Pusillimonas caeni]
MKWFRKRRGVVDAVSEIEASQDELSDAHGRPSLDGAARPMAPGAKGFLTVLALIGIALITVLVLRVTSSKDESNDRPVGRLTPRIENVLPELNLRRPVPEPTSTPDPTEPEPPPVEPKVPPVLARPSLPGETQSLLGIDPIEDRRLKAGFRRSDSERPPSSSSGASAQQPEASDSGPMADRLRPMRLSAAAAGLLRNRDLLLTQGAMIDCVQQTRFVSAQAGMITCYATRDVRSATGRVVLIDAGTKFTGYQQSVLAHGQPRIGVVWSRLETPDGVVVHLDSPATGPLGEAGLDGEIDSHFAERFSAAIMISLIDDLGSYLSNRSSGQGQDSIRLDRSSDAARDAVGTVLDNTINIPPTLYRNQGGRVGIFVARDLDFSSVYDLQVVQASTVMISR